MKISQLALIIMLALLTGCGFEAAPEDNTNGGSTNTSGTPKTGQFKDANVEGLQYASGGNKTKKSTNNLGEFNYRTDETVTFYIGGAKIGEAKGKRIITPVDLVTNGNSNTPEVLNIVRFLLALDEDNNGANGITIPTQTLTIAENWGSLNFKIDIDNAPGGQIALLAPTFTMTIGTEANAKTHLEDTLQCLHSGAFVQTEHKDRGYIVNSDGTIQEVLSNTITPSSASTPIDFTQTDLSSIITTSRIDSTNTISGTMTITTTQTVTITQTITIKDIDKVVDTTSGSKTDNPQLVTSRIGGKLGAKYRVAGVLSNGRRIIFAVDIADNNAVSGESYDIAFSRKHDLIGSFNGSSLNLNFFAGEIKVGATDNIPINLNSDTTINRDDVTGSGCRLN